MDHLRYAGLPAEEQEAALIAIVRAEPLLMQVLEGMRALALPDPLLVAGAVYNTVWNQLTARPPLTGIKDIDIAYFDGTDLSWEAEDREIKRVERQFSDLPVPVELRNQARVHLWFPQKFGQLFSPLKTTRETLGRYASKTHAVGLCLEADDTISVVAPFGLDPIFSFQIVPNHVLDNKASYEAKGARALTVWPELTVEPW